MMKLLKERKNKSSDSFCGDPQSFLKSLTHPVFTFMVNTSTHFKSNEVKQ